MVNRNGEVDYIKLLDEAGEDAEGEADEILLDERLKALGLETGEAEKLAALADKPRERKDGTTLGTPPKNLRPLTDQQITFAQGVIEGKTRKQAYREAYPNQQGSDATISAAAHKLAKDPRIQRLINTAWEETEEALSDDLAVSYTHLTLPTKA